MMFGPKSGHLAGRTEMVICFRASYFPIASVTNVDANFTVPFMFIILKIIVLK